MGTVVLKRAKEVPVSQRVSIPVAKQRTGKTAGLKNRWRIEQVGVLTLVFSPLLSKYSGLIHAFTTRLGGDSPEPIHSFNLSLTRNVNGSKKDALKNRRALCRALKLNFAKLVVPYQTHSPVVRWLAAKSIACSRADGLATTVAGVPMLLQFADCVPVILYDTRRNAVAVLHAGWRGTAGGIAVKGLELLLKKTGSAPGDIAAAVGPAIGSCCYPTGQEVLQNLSKSTRSLKGLVRYHGGVPHPDLKGVNARQLRQAGVRHVDVCPLCTSCNPKLFYSHRKFKGKTGHQGAIAALAAILLFIYAGLIPCATAEPDFSGTTEAGTVHKDSGKPTKGTTGDTTAAKTGKSNIHLTPESAKLAVPPPAPPAKPIEQTASKTEASQLVQYLDQLEQATYGAIHSAGSIEERLSSLEQLVFDKTFESQDTQERVKHLCLTLLGLDISGVHKPDTQKEDSKNVAATKAESDSSDHKELSTEELYRFALAEINAAREEQDMHTLQWDEVALKVAQQHTRDLCTSGNFNQEGGDNPDLSYTKLGGTDALTESVVTINCDAGTGNNKATVLKILQAINSHQDYRDSVFSPDATHFGLAYGTSARNNKIVACIETVTRHAAMHSIPRQIHPGEKIEVKGVVMEPYHFKLITLAWEGENPAAGGNGDAEEDAALYFPPLDYIAYGQKGQHGEHDKLIAALRITGVVAAVAGGMFIPPVILAAPLIAMAGSSPSEPHAISEIPVRGGVKVTGSLFYGTIPVSHQNKEGLYYVTVWASVGESKRPVPVSRRVITAKADTSTVADDSIKLNSQEKPSVVQELK